jgi:ABC-type transport system involved in cytochrome bd biosynthesis fused ATPase/permease subunit
MKWLIYVLFIITCNFSFAQVDTCFTEKQIHQISETLDSLYYTDSVNNQLINQQTSLIEELEHVIKLDSLQLDYKQQQINLLKNNIDLYVERQKKLQPKWYDNKLLWFSSGILTSAVTSIFIIQAIK